MVFIGGPIPDIVFTLSRIGVLTVTAPPPKHFLLLREFHLADVYDLPFDDCAFDACRADRIFHFLNRPAAALRETIRVTRVGGRIAVTEPTGRRYRSRGETMR